MIATFVSIDVFTQWLADKQCFFLWGMKRNRHMMGSMELKQLLFGWHQPSFYGTFIETSVWDHREGILLSAAMALDYYGSLPPHPFLQIHWSEEQLSLLEICPGIRHKMDNEQLLPDYVRWLEHGDLGWKLDIPQEQTAEIKMKLPYFEDWLNKLLTEPAVQQIARPDKWQRVSSSYPIEHRDYVPEGLIENEEDWLQAIGWKEDNTPFRVCLQLLEPEPGYDNWELRIQLQDRHNKDVLVEYKAQSDYPESWVAHLNQVEQIIRKWCIIVPSLSKHKEAGNDRPPSLQSDLDHDEAWEFLTESAIWLVKYGYTVLLPSWWETIGRAEPKIKAKIKSSVGSKKERMFGLQQIVKFDWKLAIGDTQVTEEEFQALLLAKRKLVQFRGRWIQLDPAKLQQVEQTMKAKKKGLTLGDVLALHLANTTADGALPNQLSNEDEIEAGNETSGEAADVPLDVELNEHLFHMVNQLRHQSEIPLIDAPQGFNGTLRNYQLQGSSWLVFLRNFGLGSCLADDMGLGKTIQYITYLLHIVNNEDPGPPSLLICPTSVLGNWQKELERFAPELKVHLHYGKNRKQNDRFADSVSQYDLVLTSYSLAHLDEELLSSVQWNSLCLDEAQNIKNAYTKQSSAVRRLHATHHIALTGTPIENRLTELWSIYDFLNPGYLGSLSSFNHHFVTAIEKNNNPQLIGRVQRIVQPFLLRRVKTDPKIELDLPEKLEFKTFVSLTAEQGSLYENTIQDLFKRLETLTAMERRGLILATLTKLKQLCNHPSLFLKEGKDSAWQQRSNKIERLLEMVSELRQEGDSCLIFTQYVEMGNMLQVILESELKEPVQFLHGGTSKSQRDAMVTRFQSVGRINSALEAQTTLDIQTTLHTQSPPCHIFILSLKAGGVGLNLTAANHVFHFDRWWNPAVENQATDRTHRLGQHKLVQVHKFITLGTLEERIDEMIDRKQGMSQQIVGDGSSWITELSTEELRELFVLRKEWLDA